MSDDVTGPDGTIEMSETQRRMRAHLNELVEELNRVSAETTDENRFRLDKLEKDLLQLMKTIDNEREDTLSKT